MAEAALQPWSEAQFRATLAAMQSALPEAEFEWAEGREKWAMFLGEDEVVAILHVDTPLALVHQDLLNPLQGLGIVLAPFPNWGLPSYRIDYADAVRLLPDWNWEPDMKDHPIRVAMPMDLYLNTV
ncbi:hypothetical protein EON81_24420 [bacterium]|nr:MAG: hypothetical protein EON81_24420 [bacterium]